MFQILPLHKIKANKSDMEKQQPRSTGADNCKFIFMLYVVLWHTAHTAVLESAATQSQHWTNDITRHMVMRYWLWTEKIAVPGFAFLSGFFSKGFLASSRGKHSNDQTTRQHKKEVFRWERTISTLLFGPLFYQFTVYVLGQLVQLSWSRKIPPWPPAATFDFFEALETWYLFSLLIWRLCTPFLIARLKFPIASSVIISILGCHANMGGPSEMSERVTFFLPFYVAGLYCDKQRLAQKHQKIYQIFGMIGVASTLGICQVVDRDWLGWKYHIASWSLKPHLVLLFQYGLAGVAVWSIILVLWPTKTRLLPFGHSESTLAIYLGHWPIAGLVAWGDLPFAKLKITQQSLMFRIVYHHAPIVTVLSAHIISWSVCLLLGSKVAWSYLLQFVFDPKWLSRRLLLTKCDDDDSIDNAATNSGNEASPLLPFAISPQNLPPGCSKNY